MVNPYVGFCHALASIAPRSEKKQVILAPTVGFLQNRIRKALPDHVVTRVDQCKNVVEPGTIFVVNIDCRRRHEPYTFLDFEELLHQRRGACPEPMSSLQRASASLNPGDKIIIASLSPLMNSKLVKKYLMSSKFSTISQLSDHAILVEKRKLLRKEIGGRYGLEEVEGERAIADIHAFSKQLYVGTHNYNEDIDSLFAFQSDYYRIVEAHTGRVITCGRVAWQLPGYPLPMMLAVKAQSDQHIYLTDPDNHSYGEVYAPYLLSKTTGRVYGELIRMVYDYCASGKMDYILTTYQSTKHEEYRFLSRCIGFKDTGVRLQYGNFGGEWTIVYGSDRMFDQNWKIKFATPGHVPTMLTNFQS
jgi:hypothetical protein